MHMFTDTFQVAFPAFRRRCCRKSPRPRRDLAGSRRHACSTHARANRPHTRTHARAHARTHAHTHAHTHLPVLIWLAAGGRASRNTCKQPARMRARTHARHTQAFTHADLAGSRRQACTNTLTYVATHANCPSTHAPQSTNSSATSTARMPRSRPPRSMATSAARRPPSAAAQPSLCAAHARARVASTWRRRADPPTTGLAWPIVGHRRVPRGQPPLGLFVRQAKNHATNRN